MCRAVFLPVRKINCRKINLSELRCLRKKARRLSAIEKVICSGDKNCIFVSSVRTFRALTLNFNRSETAAGNAFVPLKKENWIVKYHNIRSRATRKLQDLLNWTDLLEVAAFQYVLYKSTNKNNTNKKFHRRALRYKENRYWNIDALF